jgi:hypothetical protein
MKGRSNLGGSKTDHKAASKFFLEKAEKQLDAAGHGPCQRRFEALLEAARTVATADSEASWVGKVSESDERLHANVSHVEEGVVYAKGRFLRDCPLGSGAPAGTLHGARRRRRRGR